MYALVGLFYVEFPAHVHSRTCMKSTLQLFCMRVNRISGLTRFLCIYHGVLAGLRFLIWHDLNNLSPSSQILLGDTSLVLGLFPRDEMAFFPKDGMTLFPRDGTADNDTTCSNGDLNFADRSQLKSPLECSEQPRQAEVVKLSPSKSNASDVTYDDGSMRIHPRAPRHRFDDTGRMAYASFSPPGSRSSRSASLKSAVPARFEDEPQMVMPLYRFVPYSIHFSRSAFWTLFLNGKNRLKNRNKRSSAMTTLKLLDFSSGKHPSLCPPPLRR